jgi:hypothetical protein
MNIQLSLTDFVDIVSTSGTPKATKVHQIKHRPAYNPMTDFYKRIREGIIETHQTGKGKANIDVTIKGLTDPKKRAAYPYIATQYKKWWGRKSLVWFEPLNVLYKKPDISIAVNPELGLEIDGVPHLIKLYFKVAPLAKNRVNIITHLMEITASNEYPYPPNTIMSVLDVRRGKLFLPTVSAIDLTGMLNAELAYITTLWPTI